jgi:molybdate transport system substrate-binding protein
MLSHMRGLLRAGTAVLALGFAFSGCGSSSDDDLLVSAATSLKAAFTSYGEQFDDANAQFSFAGSDELAAQIRSGAKPDVFAAANTKLPDQLYKEGLVERPVVFASNRLVLAVPAGNAKLDTDGEDIARVGDITTLGDIAYPGVKIAIGAPTVPIGSYTRKVLARLDRIEREGILANVRSNEPDVGGISAKLTQGAVDAGFLYITDVEATNGRLRAIELPENLQPEVAYGVALVRGSKHHTAAKDFVDGLLDGDGAAALKAAGFEPPPT